MDQKNTIVKCKAHPNCLFNHNGVCDNYVINIGADGKCECYVETASEKEIIYENAQRMLEKAGVTLTIAQCEDCTHFEDTGLLQCPCDKHEQYVYRKAPVCDDFKAKRGQRAKCNFFDDACDVSFLKEDLEKIQQTLEQDSISCTMKVAELNKTNKNKTTIKEVMPECDFPVCGWSCKYALRSGPSFNPELWCDKMKGKPAVGLFCFDYEEEKNEV